MIGHLYEFLEQVNTKKTNVASVGSVFNDTRKVKVLSLPVKGKGSLTFLYRFRLPFAKHQKTPVFSSKCGEVYFRRVRNSERFASYSLFNSSLGLLGHEIIAVKVFCND